MISLFGKLHIENKTFYDVVEFNGTDSVFAGCVFKKGIRGEYVKNTIFVDCISNEVIDLSFGIPVFENKYPAKVEEVGLYNCMVCANQEVSNG